MLQFDWANLSREELREVIEKRCSDFGTVKSVTVIMDQDARFALAAIEMSSEAEMFEILRNFGDQKVDSMVVTRIEPLQKSVAPERDPMNRRRESEPPPS